MMFRHLLGAPATQEEAADPYYYAGVAMAWINAIAFVIAVGWILSSWAT